MTPDGRIHASGESSASEQSECGVQDRCLSGLDDVRRTRESEGRAESRNATVIAYRAATRHLAYTLRQASGQIRLDERDW